MACCRLYFLVLFSVLPGNAVVGCAASHSVESLAGQTRVMEASFQGVFFFFFRRLCVVQVVNVISGLWQVLLLVLNKYRYVKYFLSLEMSM